MRRKAVAVFVALAGLATTVGPGALAAEPSAGTPTVTRSTRATFQELAPARLFTSPSVAVDPANPARVVATTIDLRTKRCRFLRSADSGLSWTLLDASPSLDSYPGCFHPPFAVTTMTPTAFGRDGRVYTGIPGWDYQDTTESIATFPPGGNISVFVARSDDLGDSWNTTLVRDARGKTGAEAELNAPIPALVVDAENGPDDIVYLNWMQSLPKARPSPPRPPFVSVSTDGAKTFAPPVRAIGEEFERSLGGQVGAGSRASMAIADDGTLYVLIQASVNVGETSTNMLVLSRSEDQGKTYTSTKVIETLDNTAQPGLVWSPEGGEAGTLHFVYEDKGEGPLGDRDIFYRRSLDGGATFSDPRRLNDDDPTARYLQSSPNLSIAPNGRIDAVWWDFRDDRGLFANDVYYGYSLDNGATWSQNVRVSDRTIPRKIGVWSNNFDIRQPPGVASTDKLAIFAWDDTREGDALTDTQDVFSAVAQFEALGSKASGWRYVIGGAGGLALTGLALLVFSLIGGRRNPETSAPPSRDPAAATKA